MITAQSAGTRCASRRNAIAVAISNSRGPETLRDLVAELGPNARAVTPEEAARFGEFVLLAIPLKDYTTLPAEELRGKVVIDAMNYYPNRDGHIAQLDSRESASSELVAAHLPGARVVKAFNTIWFEHLKTLAMLYSSDAAGQGAARWSTFQLWSTTPESFLTSLRDRQDNRVMQCSAWGCASYNKDVQPTHQHYFRCSVETCRSYRAFAPANHVHSK